MLWTNLMLLLTLGIHTSSAKCRLYENNIMAECISLDEEQLLAFIEESGRRLGYLKVENSFIPHIEMMPIRYNSLRSLIMRNSRIATIAKLGQVLRETGNLREIDLSFNTIKEISFLVDTSSLNKISLHHNQIEFLDASALTLNSELFYLDLSYNNIKNHTSLQNYYLNSLNLSHNSIEEIKGSFEQLTNIITIDLSFNKLRKVSVDDFGNLSRIQYLNLSHNEIYTIQYDPPSMYESRYLFWRYYTSNGVLDLSHNKLKNFSHIFNDKSIDRPLKSINLENNNLEDISFLANLTRENSVQTLIFRHNKIKKLHPFNFRGFSLDKLDISFNQIESIPSAAFQRMSDLTELFLDHNQITYLNDSIFDNLRFLRLLNLSYNPIETVSQMIFGKLTLNVLDLSHCLLSEVPVGIFSNKTIFEIYLNDNNIKTIKPNTFSSLYVLDLSNNKMKRLQPKLFSGIRIGGYLNLSNNPLESLERVFDDAKIDRVSLTNLSLSRLTKMDVRGLNMTYYLDLSHSGIEEIDSNIFDGCSVMTDLYLDDNFLKMIPSNLFGFNDQLVTLSIVGNPLSIIPLDSFPHKIGLKHLHLTINGNILKKRFFNMIFLTDLHIVNSKITKLHKHSFKGLISLKKLDFENSTVSKIEPGSFLGLRNVVSDFDAQNLFSNISNLRSKTFVGLERLQTLNLSSLAVVTIEDCAFCGLDSLVNLSLSNNKIGDLPKNSFVGLKTLKTLDLSNNNLTGKESTFPIGIFKELVNLTHLHLQHNRIIKFHIGEFSNLRNLRFLNLSHNQLSYLDRHLLFPLRNLEVLDINSNHVIKFDYHFTLKHLSSLKTIGIGENKWPCENMTIMLNDFEEHGVNYRAISKLEFDVENMGGIYCVHVCNYLYCPTEEDLVVTY
ncbi:toll-like receptor 3 [Coccinella septempunctata]|uniref:toll-like receptor 3 n=1 Tax=Coccinella septempunctata TaxID=41139 RepID=UPI001D09737D|nr:toll-like receptor 3 [Coccinella septempunctata]